MPKLYYASSSPFRWTQLLLDKSSTAAEKLADQIISSISDPSSSGAEAGATRRFFSQVAEDLEPILQPLMSTANRVVSDFTSTPEVQKVGKEIEAIGEVVEKYFQNVESTIDDL